MKLKPETVGFVRGGALYLEPPHRWRTWQRDVWTCCGYTDALLEDQRAAMETTAQAAPAALPAIEKKEGDR